MRREKVSHVTKYRFSDLVSLLLRRLLLCSRENHNVRIESSTLKCVPVHALHWTLDLPDNSLAVVDFLEPSDPLRIFSNLGIQRHEENPSESLLDEYVVSHPFDDAEEDRVELVTFQQASCPGIRRRVVDRVGNVLPLCLTASCPDELIKRGRSSQPGWTRSARKQ